MLELLILLVVVYVVGAALTAVQDGAGKYTMGWGWPLRAWKKMRAK